MRILSICSNELFIKIKNSLSKCIHTHLPLNFEGIDFSINSDYDAMIFSSRNSVKFSYKLISEELLNKANLFAVGDETAKLIPREVIVPENKFGLEPILEKISGADYKKVLYLCGLHSSYLKNENKYKFIFHPVACYRIKSISSIGDELAIIKVPELIILSCEYSLMVTKKFKFSTEALKKVKVIIMNKNLENKAIEFGFKNIYATKNNKSSELIELVKEKFYVN
mgnify:CR=1 FL=1